MRRLPIRIKVMAALVLPLAALSLVTVVEVRDAVQEAHEVSDETRLARAATGPNGLFTSLQNERNRAAVDLVGYGGAVQLPVADNTAARQATDASRAEFEAVIAEQGGGARQAYASSLAELDELERLRSDVDAVPRPYSLEANSEVAGDIFTRYTAVVGELISSSQRLSSSIENEDLRRGTELSYKSSLQQDLLARLTRTLLLSIPTGGLDEGDEIRDAAGLLRLATRNFEDIRITAVDDYRPLAEQLVDAEHDRGLLERIAPMALASGQVDADGLLASVSESDEDAYLYDFRDEVRDILIDEADEVEAAASLRRASFLGLGAAVLLFAALATWLVSRSITRPLSELTRQAADMANRRLPDAVQGILDTPLGEDVTVREIEPVAVRTRDEVADVSAALNTVQDSALDLAVEQAVLRRNIADSFANLGRRNQNLLSRQLDFITHLEQNETDPEVLRDLFRLDHLATRMRRNAESLLVLAGIDPPRQWAAPVRINDVVRAALGEVEGYQRVGVSPLEPVTVLGSAAADLAHILAELVENALVFSPEDQSVEVRGRARVDGPDVDDGTYTLAVIDHGLGMTPDELARANRRLAGTESFTVAPSKYLGHYVAGNLAARHGISIVLHNTLGGGPHQAGYARSGITALIRLPASLSTTPTVGIAATEASAGGGGAGGAAGQGDVVADPDGGRELVGVGGSAAPRPAPSLTGRTASGLVRRSRPPAAGHPAPEFAPPSDLIDALAQHTSFADPPQPPPPPPPPAPPAAPATSGPGQTSGRLTRRIRGSQPRPSDP